VGVGDAAAQATACLDNLATLLDVHGFERGDVRRLVIYVVGEHANLSVAWRAVTAWWGEVPPATLLGVSLLGYPDQLVEIDATVRRD
jgi:enamine deaminase RidA (YjgF/YER057c/UK114 family)